MSVLVKDLEMPGKGYIDVRIFRDGTAVIATGEKPYYRELKAVEVPTPHGRLIDANALKETLDYYIREAGWSEKINMALGWVKDDFIDAEPTVIEAECTQECLKDCPFDYEDMHKSRHCMHEKCESYVKCKRYGGCKWFVDGGCWW